MNDKFKDKIADAMMQSYVPDWHDSNAQGREFGNPSTRQARRALSALKGVERAERFTAGVLFRWGSLWVGAHWSGKNRRLCVNLVPFVTVFFVLKGGVRP